MTKEGSEKSEEKGPRPVCLGVGPTCVTSRDQYRTVRVVSGTVPPLSPTHTHTQACLPACLLQLASASLQRQPQPGKSNFSCIGSDWLCSLRTNLGSLQPGKTNFSCIGSDWLCSLRTNLDSLQPGKSNFSCIGSDWLCSLRTSLDLIQTSCCVIGRRYKYALHGMCKPSFT